METEISFYFYEYGKFEAQSFLNDFHKELNIFQNEEKHKIEIERLEDEIKILNDVIKDYEQNMVKAERVQRLDWTLQEYLHFPINSLVIKSKLILPQRMPTTVLNDLSFIMILSSAVYDIKDSSGWFSICCLLWHLCR